MHPKERRLELKNCLFRITVGSLVATAVMMILCVTVSALTSNGTIQEERYRYYALGILMLAAFAGAIVSSWTERERQLVISAVCGVLLALILLICGAITGGGDVDGVGVRSLAVVGSAVSAGIVLKERGSGGKKRRRKRRR